jgi:hypothetical protein
VAGQLRDDSRASEVLHVRRIYGARTQPDAHPIDGEDNPRSQENAT